MVSEHTYGKLPTWASVTGGFWTAQKDKGFVHDDSKQGAKIFCYPKEEDYSEFLEDRRLNDFKKFISFPMRLHEEKLTEMDVTKSKAKEENKKQDRKEGCEPKIEKSNQQEKEPSAARSMTPPTLTWAARAKLVQTQPVPRPRRPRQVGPERAQRSFLGRLAQKPKNNTTSFVPRNRMVKNLRSAPKACNEKCSDRQQYSGPTKNRPLSVFIRMGRLLMETAKNDAESDADEEEVEKGRFDSVPPAKKTPKTKRSRRVLRTRDKTSKVKLLLLATAVVRLLLTAVQFAVQLRGSLSRQFTFSPPTVVAKLKKNDTLHSVNRGSVLMRRRRRRRRNLKGKNLNGIVLLLLLGTGALLPHNVAFSPTNSAMTKTWNSFSQDSASWHASWDYHYNGHHHYRHKC